MADVAVKKVEEKAKDEKSVSRQQEQGLSRQGWWDPFSSWTASDFFANPFAVMRRLHDEMDRNFGRFLNREGGSTEGFWSPAIEVKESEGQLKVHAELPGLKPEEVKVEIAENQLVIQGERKSEREEKNKGFYRSERRYGQFYRAIPLPEGTNADQAKAQFNNGVLEVSLPLPEQKSNRREIPIQS
jgi:HSP20 family protein